MALREAVLIPRTFPDGLRHVVGMKMLMACLLALGQQPSLEETLAWLKDLDVRPDAAPKSPRFPALTLEELRGLKAIRLGGHRASDNKHVAIPAAEFKHLAALPALEKADLVEIDGLTDEALAQVAKIATLTELNLGDAWVTNAGLPALTKLKALRRLDLGWTKDVGDSGLAVLAKIKTLEQLGLGGTKVTDAGLPALAALPKLRELSLQGTAVTDQGLQALAACKSLTTLTLGKKMKVTPQGVDALKKALPACTVVLK